MKTSKKKSISTTPNRNGRNEAKCRVSNQDSSTSASTKKKLRGYRPKRPIRTRGATAPSGRPYVWVSACAKTAWIPYSDFGGSGSDARELLAARGIILLKSEWADLQEKVARLKSFPPKPLIEAAGLSKHYYSLVDGTVFGARKEDMGSPPIVLFERDRRKVATRGTLQEWMARVGEPLSGQFIATFVLMIMFAGAMVRLVGRTSNFGFELAGPKGVGKTTAQLLAASIWGPAVSPNGRNFWVSAHATVAGLEGLMAEHSDMAMIIEETNLFAAGETEKVRANKVNQFVFQLANGKVKSRYKQTKQTHHAFIYLTSTNEALEQIMLPERDEVTAAARDRLLTIPIGSDRPFGLFDSVPEGFASASAFAASLNQAIASNYGHPIRAFLAKLVETRNADRKALQARIAKLMAKYREAVNVDLDNGSATRVADEFGLVYAAGQLAKEWGALPPSMLCLKAARIAYELNRSTVEHHSPAEKVEAFARRSVMIRYTDCKLPRLTEEAANNAPGFLRTMSDGSNELILTTRAMSKAFPDRNGILKDSEVRAMLVSDGGRRATKRVIRRGGKPVRVYCFRIAEARN